MRLIWEVEYECLEENNWPIQVTLIAHFSSGSQFQSCFQKGWQTYAPIAYWFTPPNLPMSGAITSRGVLLQTRYSGLFPLSKLLEQLECEPGISPLEAEVLSHACSDHWWKLFDAVRTASTTWMPSILRFKEWDEILTDLAFELSGETQFA